MRKIKNFYAFCKSKYKILNEKKYTTVAGTLVFFLIMSMMPLAFWLTLILGKLPAPAERMLKLPIFHSIGEIVEYIRRETERATGAASIFLAITTLYSATNLFYQMRKSGEIIYDVKILHNGIKSRIGALSILLIVLFLSVVLISGFAMIAFLTSKILPEQAQTVADYVLLLVGVFVVVLLFNTYVCPYRVPIKCFLIGSFFTLGAWVIASVGFGVYLYFSNVDRLYGALSTVIVFLLWLYILMICFVSGVVFNSERVEKYLNGINQAENNKKV